MIGPGAHHPSYYGSPYQNQSFRGSHASIQPMGTAGPDNAQLMAMLRLLLAEQKATGEERKAEIDDLREDQALVRKEAFGTGKDNKEDKTAERTARAERSDSLSSGSSSSSYSNDSDEVFPNPWARFRHTMREPFAEFFGTCGCSHCCGAFRPVSRADATSRCVARHYSAFRNRCRSAVFLDFGSERREQHLWYLH